MLLGGALAVGAALPLAGLAATAQAADTGASGVASAADTTPPLLDRFAFAAGPSGWYRSNPAVRVVATERGESGVADLSYILDGAPVVTVPAEPGAMRLEVALDLSAHGVHELEVWTTDRAGNESWHQTGTYRVDLLAPTVRLPADASYETGEAATLAYACDDQLSGIADCTAAVPDGGALDTSTPGTFTVPVTATDVAGNSATAVFTYTVRGADATGPAVAIHVAPEPGSGWYASYLGVEVTADDPAGIASLHWSTDGPVSSNGDVVGEAWGGFDLAVDGVTEISAWAYDSLGNRGEAERRIVRIDTVSPRIDLASPSLPTPAAAGGPVVLEFEQGERVPLEYDCIDEHSGIASCLAQGELPAVAAGEFLPTEELGEQAVTVRGLDLAGNETALELRYLVVEQIGGGDDDGDGGDGGDDGGDGDGDGDGDGGGGHGGDGFAGPDSGRDEPSVLAETGFPVLPGILLVAGLLAAGAVLLTSRSTPHRGPRDDG